MSGAELERRALFGRKVASEVFGFFDKYDFPPESKDKMKRLLKAGTGIIITANHPSEMDPPKILAMLFADGFFRKRHIVAPVGAHQIHKANFANRLFGAKIELIPVVNNHTINNKPQMEMYRGKGLRKYLLSAVETLQEGGIVLVFFQAGRRPTVGSPGQQDVVLGGLMRILDRYDVNPAIVFMGVSIPELSPYSNEYRKAINVYSLRVGNVLTRQELEEELKTQGQTLDEYAFSQVKELVFPDYR